MKLEQTAVVMTVGNYWAVLEESKLALVEVNGREKYQAEWMEDNYLLELMLGLVGNLLQVEPGH